jgi:octaprenyl-diphosphate synthase
MSILDEIRDPVSGEMKLFEQHFRSSMKSNIPLLSFITNYIIRKKGKQIRPLFVFLSAKMLGNTGDSTFRAASMIELLHTATLIHDDIVDESYERRGFFSINALWKSKISVLVGDYLLSRGLLLAIDNKEFDLLGIITEAVREMSEGELLQIQKSRKLNITKDEYFNIIRKKTATLIAACTASGARSVGADQKTIEIFKKFGENVGMAFQIKDDLFDYNKKGIIGKPTGNDIKEKKFTLPLIHALENGSSSDKIHIINLIKSHHINSKKIQEIIDFAIDNKGIEYSICRMNEFKDEALSLISNYPDNDAKKSLTKLVEYVITRDK